MKTIYKTWKYLPFAHKEKHKENIEEHAFFKIGGILNWFNNCDISFILPNKIKK
jgi:hypothetical protein